MDDKEVDKEIWSFASASRSQNSSGDVSLVTVSSILASDNGS